MDMNTNTNMNTNNSALLRLLQLSSPALPVGAYAYSQGIEYAVECKLLSSEADARDWILGLIRHAHTYLEAPVFYRLYDAFLQNETVTAQYWNNWLFASRETCELQNEDQHLGRSLEFEALIRGEMTPSCPGCGSEELERLFSLPTMHTSGTHDMAMRAAKKRDQRQGAERMHAQREYELNHDD